MRSPFERVARLSSWQVHAIGLAICLTFGGVWYAAGLTPLSQARAAREAQQQELTVKREALDHLARVQAGWKLSLDRAHAETTPIPLRPTEAILDQVAALSRAAASVGLTLDEVKPGQPATKERFTTLPVRMSGTGAFPGIVSFFHEVRRSFPDTGIVGFDLHSEPEHPDKPAVFTIDLLWYAAKLPAAPAQAAPARNK
jgi:Tfp pilus assembly protein PilO